MSRFGRKGVSAISAAMVLVVVMAAVVLFAAWYFGVFNVVTGRPILRVSEKSNVVENRFHLCVHNDGMTDFNGTAEIDIAGMGVITVSISVPAQGTKCITVLLPQTPTSGYIEGSITFQGAEPVPFRAVVMHG